MACRCAEAFRAEVAAQTAEWILAAMPPRGGDGGFMQAPVWGPLPAFSPSCQPLCAEAEELLDTHFRREERESPHQDCRAPLHTEERL
jgi:hypothetical protein